jgi:hypothetical protein
MSIFPGVAKAPEYFFEFFKVVFKATPRDAEKII